MKFTPEQLQALEATASKLTADAANAIKASDTCTNDQYIKLAADYANARYLQHIVSELRVCASMAHAANPADREAAIERLTALIA